MRKFNSTLEVNLRLSPNPSAEDEYNAWDQFGYSSEFVNSYISGNNKIKY